MSACKDCDPGSTRPAPNPGPRCATHWRIVKRARKAAAHEGRVQKVYGLPAGRYAELHAEQGGRCAICAWATGATKRLAVDHNHECCAGPTSCGKCVRGLLCGPCNQLVGRLGPVALRRAADYIERNQSTPRSVQPE